MHSQFRPPLPVALAVLALGVAAAVLAVVLLGDGGDSDVVTKFSGDLTPEERDAQRAADETFFPTDLRSSFGQFAETQPGRVQVAIAPLGKGPVRMLGARLTAPAWSAMTAPLVVAVLRDAGGPRGLAADQRRWAQAALMRSDDTAASALLTALARRLRGVKRATAAIEAVLRAAGDGTSVEAARTDKRLLTVGRTRWSARGATLFHRALARGCLLDRDGTEYVMRALRGVAAAERWGLAGAGLPEGTPVAVKAGSGPRKGGAYVVRQSGIVGTGADAYVATIVARTQGRGMAAFAAGRRRVDATARWTRDALGADRSRPSASCRE